LKPAWSGLRLRIAALGLAIKEHPGLKLQQFPPLFFS
jgi:hypothetical protein